MQRMARIGAVPAASTALWLSKGAEAALAGTMPTKAERKRGAGAGVPPIRLIDTAETIDPVGRAWAAGLLDGVPGIEPADLRDAGRRFAALYWRKLPGSSPVSSLYANMVSGLVDELPPGVDREQLIEDADARDERQEAALNRMLDGLKQLGREVRKVTDEITLDPFADAGPAWLDWLVAARAAALPALSGAIARGMTVNAACAYTGDPAAETVGMVLGIHKAEDRPVEPGDWGLFLPASAALRWSDCTGRLALAIRGLVLIYHGGRLIC
jgi:hypothetical protein